MKSESFTIEEEALLRPYVTNLDKPIFALTSALPQVIAGAGFSRYSRSREPLRRVLLDEFLRDSHRGIENIANVIARSIATKQTSSSDRTKALEIAKEVYQKLLDPSETIRAGESFYEKVLEEFGDESVNELMGAHIALEGVSNILTKVLEDPRLMSPLEKSTRYVVFEVDSFLLFEKIGLPPKHKKLYEETCRYLLQTYSDLVDPMREFLRRKSPKEEFLFQITKDSEPIPIQKIKDETIQKEATDAYNRTIRGKYCDILRYLLPASTLTNMGIYANGRSHEHLIMKLLSSELMEAREVGEAYLVEIEKVLPSAVKRVRQKYGKIGIEYLRNRRKAQKELSKELKIKGGQAGMPVPPVRLLHYEDRETAERKVLTALLYEDRNEPWEEIQRVVSKMSEAERQKAIKQVLADRTNYRHKPPRAFEFIDYIFELLADYGAYRDLHRHRMLTQERQFLTPLHGYEIPPELQEADEELPEVRFKDRFERCMEKSHEAWEKIVKEFPLESQYLVAFAYRIRWVKKFHLKEAFHLCELRSGQGGHPSYRKMVQEIARKIQEVHPILGEGMLIDWGDYDLERSASEIRTAQKVLSRTKGS